jgi:hypothetical protein
MKAFLLFFRVWLWLVFVLVHFVIPFYLVAIYPEIPDPAIRIVRSAGYGLVRGDASLVGFWYRFTACGAWVSIGLLLIWRHIRPDISDTNTNTKNTKKIKKAVGNGV